MRARDRERERETDTEQCVVRSFQHHATWQSYITEPRVTHTDDFKLSI